MAQKQPSNSETPPALPAPPGRGRPTTFDAETALKLIRSIGATRTRAAACAAAGIAPSTFFEWLRAGRLGTDPALQEFALAVDQATRDARRLRGQVLRERAVMMALRGRSGAR